jgi:hypothetical protein
MNGYFLAEAAASRHAELLRGAQNRRRAGEARRAMGPAGSSGRARGIAVRDSIRASAGALRAFLYRGWIAPPAPMVGSKVPGDGRGAEQANLAFGPAGAATCADFLVAAGHGAG